MSSQDNEPLLGEAHPTETENSDRGRFNDASWSSAPAHSSYFDSSRVQIRRFLTSRTGHYAVLLLVSLDVCCILADFLISLFICERACGKDMNRSNSLEQAQEALGIVSLIFSCLFMAELVASIWAFALK